MEGLNEVKLLGSLGSDPELRFSQSGGAVLSLRIATNERVRKKEEWTDHTEWHSCVMFGKRAETVATFLRKGSTVFIGGKLRSSSYEKDGVKRYKTEIVVDQLIAPGGKGDSAQQRPSAAPQRGQGAHARGGYGSGYGGGEPRGSDGTPRGGYADEHTMADHTGSYGGTDDEIPFMSQPSCYSMKV